MLRFKNYLALLMSIILCSCAIEDDDQCLVKNWELQKKILSRAKNFTIAGKAAVTKDKKTNFISFKVRKEGPDILVNIAGPMGLQLVNLEQTPKGIYLIKSDNNRENLRSIMIKELGFYISPKQFSNVLIGLPNNGVYEKYENNYPKYQKYNGYGVTWKKYGCINNIFQPNKIKIQNGSDIYLTIIVNDIYLS